MTHRLLVSRVLLVAGLRSWGESVEHLGNPDLMVERCPLEPTHSWHHVFREACGDAAKVTVFLLVFFGPPRKRVSVTRRHRSCIRSQAAGPHDPVTLHAGRWPCEGETTP